MKLSEMRVVREACFDRSRGACEFCRKPIDWDAGELDHFWGRAKAPTTDRNCWMLCRQCHREKTDNKPSRTEWLLRYIRHAEGHGYTEETEKAARAYEWAAAKAASPQGRTSGTRTQEERRDE